MHAHQNILTSIGNTTIYALVGFIRVTDIFPSTNHIINLKRISDSDQSEYKNIPKDSSRVPCKTEHENSTNTTSSSDQFAHHSDSKITPARNTTTTYGELSKSGNSSHLTSTQARSTIITHTVASKPANSFRPFIDVTSSCKTTIINQNKSHITLNVSPRTSTVSGSSIVAQKSMSSLEPSTPTRTESTIETT